MRKNSTKIFLFIGISAFLSGCSTWNEEFEGKVVRAYPTASIHQISKMVDKGIIKEPEEIILSSNESAKFKVFKDGNVSRGVEDIRRMYVMTYEDSSKNLHVAHHLYLVVKPAEWSVK